MTGTELLDRAYRIMREFNLTDPQPGRWRMSDDVYQALAQATDDAFGSKRSTVRRWIPRAEDRLFGYPLDVDEGLPPDSLTLQSFDQ